MIVARTVSWRRVVGDVGRPMLACVLWAVLVSVAHVWHFDWLSFPSLPVSLLAATLGILLAFRNNSGYDRWWEARTLWGGVVNQSRTFARQLLTFLPAADRPAEDGGGVERRDGGADAARARRVDTAGAAPHRRRSDGAVRDLDGLALVEADVDRAAPEDGPVEPWHFGRVSAEARELVYAQMGYAHALRCHLRRQDPLPEIAPFFPPPVLEALGAEQNVPAAILVWMAARLRRLLDGRRPDDAFRLTVLDGTLTELANLLGGCERIKNTPIPREYDFLPRVMVRAYLVMLPLGMVRDLGLVTPAVTAVIAFLFLSLDAIGRHVETPFENDVHDTPMTALCRTVEINLRQTLGEADLPPAAQPVGGLLS